MKPTRRPIAPVLATLCLLAALPAGAETAPALPLERIELPPGFVIDLYSAGVTNARALALGSRGTVFAGSREAGVVSAVVDGDGDGRGERVVTLAEDLLMPSGLAFRDGDLYVAEIHRILRYDDVEDRLDDPGEPRVVYDRLPEIRHHGWKFIAFGPDGWLYVPVGAPCNLCESKDELFASIARLRPDGGALEIYAHGVRNTVGFDFHPETGHLWFTDNGRDWMGDDVPPDELNVAPEKGLHFGYPYCHGRDLRDPVFDSRPCSQFVAPAIELGPHVAAIGMRFYTGEQFPAEYRDQVFIAEHGSWNRSQPIGYRITLVRLEKTPEGVHRAVSYEDFARGWLGKDGEAWGRPADVLVMPDGALLISDDKAGAIYRVTYRP